MKMQPLDTLGPVSPELCLVDPELARAARACLPVNAELEAEMAELEAEMAELVSFPEPGRLRAPIPGRRRARPRPPAAGVTRAAPPRRRRRVPRVTLAG